ncbi:MAG: general secretion pathway protein K [Marinobacter sp. T13-3]|nr:MAG: general secretion pathway protein K [Marinobacter sp. T13-3]
MKPVERQQGVALIMVLLALALVVMIAAGMVSRQSRAVLLADHSLAGQQSQQVALGVEAFARQMLIRDVEDEKNGVRTDDASEPWLAYSAILPVDVGQRAVAVQVNDLSGRLNLNDLVGANGEVDRVAYERFERLFEVVGVSEVSVDALVDWIDPDNQRVSGYGAEDGAYLLQTPDYRAANQPFTSVSELRVIDGMTEDAYQALRPNVAALPATGAGVNVNLAPVPVLMSLHPQITRAAAEGMVEARMDAPYEQVQDFLAEPALAGTGMANRQLQVLSRYFEVVAQVTDNDNRRVALVSQLYRDDQGQVHTLNRSLGRNARITKPRAPM